MECSNMDYNRIRIYGVRKGKSEIFDKMKGRKQ